MPQSVSKNINVLTLVDLNVLFADFVIFLTEIHYVFCRYHIISAEYLFFQVARHNVHVTTEQVPRVLDM